MGNYRIITFYEFRPLPAVRLEELRSALRAAMKANSVKGTIILAKEGFNSTVCGAQHDIENFITSVESLLETKLVIKSSIHTSCPFRRTEVKIKPEIVTLKKPVDIARGKGTHVGSAEWNRLLSDPDVLVLDTRNDYEHQTGTFPGAINPKTKKFSELPAFVDKNLDPAKHHRVAMFCTGGIRCEKFVPYLKQIGFDEVFQLEGGVLRYLEEMENGESLWEGECFVFDDRVSVDGDLRKGNEPDHSQDKEAK